MAVLRSVPCADGLSMEGCVCETGILARLKTARNGHPTIRAVRGWAEHGGLRM